MPRLGTEVFVTDEAEENDGGNEEVYGLFPELVAPKVETAAWPVFRQLPPASWDGYGAVRWRRVPAGGGPGGRVARDAPRAGGSGGCR